MFPATLWMRIPADFEFDTVMFVRVSSDPFRNMRAERASTLFMPFHSARFIHTAPHPAKWMPDISNRETLRNLNPCLHVESILSQFLAPAEWYRSHGSIHKWLKGCEFFCRKGPEYCLRYHQRFHKIDLLWQQGKKSCLKQSLLACQNAPENSLCTGTALLQQTSRFSWCASFGLTMKMEWMQSLVGILYCKSLQCIIVISAWADCPHKKTHFEWKTLEMEVVFLF